MQEQVENVNRDKKKKRSKEMLEQKEQLFFNVK